MMSDVRDLLFPNFPRTVGNPKAFLINSREELNNFASVNSYENDKCFCSTCSYDSENKPILECLFLENDSIDPEPIRKVVLWYESHNIPYIILFSGRAGFHLHALFQPEIINQKTLKNFANIILEETQTKDLFDPHVTGDLRRLCRIPNTQRIANGWCVPITRMELFEINDPIEFKKLSVSPRFIDFTIIKRPSILEFIKEDTTKDAPIQSVETAPPKEIFILKTILRPCVYKAIRTPNPRHDFRICAVVEALNHGLTTSQIFSIFERLQWIDFEHSKTLYQIEYIEEKRKKNEFRIPFGKKRLKCEKKISCLKCVLEGEL